MNVRDACALNPRMITANPTEDDFYRDKHSGGKTEKVRGSHGVTELWVLSNVYRMINALYLVKSFLLLRSCKCRKPPFPDICWDKYPVRTLNAGSRVGSSKTRGLYASRRQPKPWNRLPGYLGRRSSSLLRKRGCDGEGLSPVRELVTRTSRRSHLLETDRRSFQKHAFFEPLLLSQC